MKHLFIFLVFAPLFSSAQTVFKIEHTSYDQIGHKLIDAGFTIERSDKDFGTLKTEWKPFCPECTPELSLDIRIKDSTAYISGNWRTNGGLRMKGPRTSINSQYAYTYPINESHNKIASAAFEIVQNFVK